MLDDVQLDLLTAAMPEARRCTSDHLLIYSVNLLSDFRVLCSALGPHRQRCGRITRINHKVRQDQRSKQSSSLELCHRSVANQIVVIQNNGKPIRERVDIALGALPLADHFLFPGRGFATHMKRQSYDRVLRRTLEEFACKGASSHSMRRSSLTKLADARTTLRHIMEVSGHQSLDVLSGYLGCTPKQRRAAINAL